MTAPVKYRPIDMAKVAAQQELMEQFEKSSSQVTGPAVGKNLWRFLPRPLGRDVTTDGVPWEVFYRHWLKSDNPDIRPAVFSCAQYFKQRCIACGVLMHFQSSRNPHDQELVKLWATQFTCLVNIIDRANPEMGPQIKRLPKTILNWLVKYTKDGYDITDPENGQDILIERVGTTINDTRYPMIRAERPSPLGDLGWIDMQHDLTNFSRVLPQGDVIRMITPHTEAFGGLSALQIDVSPREAPRQVATGRVPALQAPAKGGKKARTAEDDLEMQLDDDDV